MSRKPRTGSADDMRPEYDFSGGVRGKFYKEYMKGTNVVLLDPDVAEVFPDSQSVNAALRGLGELAKNRRRSSPRKQRRHNKTLQPTSGAQRLRLPNAGLSRRARLSVEPLCVRRLAHARLVEHNEA